MDTQANKNMAGEQRSSGIDPKGCESNGPAQAISMADRPLPTRYPGPYAEALNELRIVYNNRRTSHDVALREERYGVAADHNAYSKNILKAIMLLEAANDAVR